MQIEHPGQQGHSSHQFAKTDSQDEFKAKTGTVERESPEPACQANLKKSVDKTGSSSARREEDPVFTGHAQPEQPANSDFVKAMHAQLVTSQKLSSDHDQGIQVAPQTIANAEDPPLEIFLDITQDDTLKDSIQVPKIKQIQKEISQQKEDEQHFENKCNAQTELDCQKQCPKDVVVSKSSQHSENTKKQADRSTQETHKATKDQLKKNFKLNQEHKNIIEITDNVESRFQVKSQNSIKDLPETKPTIINIDDSDSDCSKKRGRQDQQISVPIEANLASSKVQLVKRKSSQKIPNLLYRQKLRNSSASQKSESNRDKRGLSCSVSDSKRISRSRIGSKSQVPSDQANQNSTSIQRASKTLKITDTKSKNTVYSLKLAAQGDRLRKGMKARRRSQSPQHSLMQSVKRARQEEQASSCRAQSSQLNQGYQATVSKINEEDYEDDDQELNSESLTSKEQATKRRVQKQIHKIYLAPQPSSSVADDDSISAQNVAGYGMRRRKTEGQYTIDKMNDIVFQNMVIMKEIEQEHEQQLQRAINMSLQDLVKKKKEQNNPNSKKLKQNKIRPDISKKTDHKPDNKSQDKQKANQKIQASAISVYKELPSISSSTNNNLSQDSEFEPNAEKAQLKDKVHTKVGTKSPIDFQKPIPIVKKQKLENQEQQKSNPAEKAQVEPSKKREKSKTKPKYQPSIMNAMDLSIREEFTDIVKFVDFSKANTENALYGPALIQKNQQETAEKAQQNTTEQSSQVTGSNFALSDKMSQSTNMTSAQLLSANVSTQMSENNPSLMASSVYSSQTPQHTLSLSQQTANSLQKDTSKSHFIRKKQTQCNIKRVCGVSYIKKSESKQENVRDRYEKLPPIAIQGSYTLPKNQNRHFDDQVMQREVLSALDKVLFSGSGDKMLLVTSFESSNEVVMKNYILKPHKRPSLCNGKYWLLTKSQDQQSILDSLWRFIKDKHFLVLHLKYCNHNLIKSFEFQQNSLEEGEKPLNEVQVNEQVKQFVVESDICLGILPKRGNASIKSMLKVYKLESHYENHMNRPNSKESNPYLQELLKCKGAVLQGINTLGYLSRLELYVGESQWRQANYRTKCALNTLIDILEDQISPVLQYWNHNRSQIFQDNLKNEALNLQTSQMFLNLDQVLPVMLGNDNIKQALAMKEQIKNQKSWSELASRFGLLEDDPISQAIIQNQSKPKIELKQLKNGSLSRLDNVADPLDIFNTLRKGSPVPITLINTRDCFAYDLKYIETKIDMGKDRPAVIKKEYYFDPTIDEGYPENFKQVRNLSKNADMTDIENLKIGITCYENFFSNKQLQDIEKNVEDTEEKSLKNSYLPMTAQMTYTSQALKRTKFFFGYRYMWTKTQLQDPLANVAAGVRADVSQPPVWFKSLVEEPMVKNQIVDKGFINSVALNVYHDGSEGLAQHFDDATRFKQPIYTLRLFSDSRLSFGSQYYGFQNSAYTIPLPRGCICIMQEGSYSANGIKHCIRPCDMTGKSSAVILRQMHPNVVEEAKKLDRNIDLPMWLSTLTLDDITENPDEQALHSSESNTKVVLPFYRQKELECEWLDKLTSGQACQTRGRQPSSHQRSAKSPVPNNKDLKSTILGKKRPQCLGRNTYSCPFDVDQTQYNPSFKYDSEEKREIGNLMHAMIYRCEQMAYEDKDCNQRIQRLRSENASAKKRQKVNGDRQETTQPVACNQNKDELEAVPLFSVVRTQNSPQKEISAQSELLECGEKVEIVTEK